MADVDVVPTTEVAAEGTVNILKNKRRIMRRFLWVPYVRTVRFNSYL